MADIRTILSVLLFIYLLGVAVFAIMAVCTKESKSVGVGRVIFFCFIWPGVLAEVAYARLLEYIEEGA